MHLLVLSGENLELSEYEALCLLGIERYSRKENLLIAQIPKKNLSRIFRLAFTKKVYELLIDVPETQLTKELESYAFNKIYVENFCVRIHGIDDVKISELERLYAGFIWRNLKASGIDPKVNLDDPKTLIEFFYSKKRFYVCKLLWENTSDFESRKAHLRPELHPTSMHPKLARSLVNILNPSGKKTISDPMCGSAGILIEAGLMGMQFKGCDIDEMMLKRAKKNFDYYKINPKFYRFTLQDSLKSGKFRDIICDLPYGKSSKKSEALELLYAKFASCIAGRAVVVFPDQKKYREIIKKNLSKDLAVLREFKVYIHKSLTRRIIVVDKR